MAPGWSDAEEKNMLMCIALHGIENSKRWEKVAGVCPGKKPDAARKHFGTLRGNYETEFGPVTSADDKPSKGRKRKSFNEGEVDCDEQDGSNKKAKAAPKTTRAGKKGQKVKTETKVKDEDGVGDDAGDATFDEAGSSPPDVQAQPKKAADGKTAASKAKSLKKANDDGDEEVKGADSEEAAVETPATGTKKKQTSAAKKTPAKGKATPKAAAAKKTPANSKTTRGKKAEATDEDSASMEDFLEATAETAKGSNIDKDSAVAVVEGGGPDDAAGSTDDMKVVQDSDTGALKGTDAANDDLDAHAASSETGHVETPGGRSPVHGAGPTLEESEEHKMRGAEEAGKFENAITPGYQGSPGSEDGVKEDVAAMVIEKLQGQGHEKTKAGAEEMTDC
ncbi:hypothetical protein CAC42_760 [Sphaceloma murrayae]|uniref:Myb-like domain-containing protein n=1 Tax=Sphaceloma murrayae TaxID=2082308 RepID=A0A2K1QKM7_9PEZI|nr:hypothetical protein CAC42_760 [Sphaceloma murrayae]